MRKISIIKSYLEKPYIYFYVYTTIFSFWLQLKFAKWRFNRTEEKLMRLKWEVERQWDHLPYLNKSKAKLTQKKLQSIEKMLQEKEVDIENTRSSILFIEISLDKMLKIVQKQS